MGSLILRGSTWWAYYYDRSNIRQRVSTHTADKTVARNRLRDLELATTDRAAHATEDLAAALSYFVDVVHAGSPAGTVRCYSQKARHVKRLLGDHLVDHLKREGVERYIASRLDEGAHTHSIHKELVVLRGALKASQARDRFHGSLDVVPHFDAGYVPRTTYLTVDEFEKLLDHLVQDRGPNVSEATGAKQAEKRRQRVLYCALIAFASPRRGEIESLRREHVDLKRGTIAIPKGKTIGRFGSLPIASASVASSSWPYQRGR